MYSETLIGGDNEDDIIAGWIAQLKIDLSTASTDITRGHRQSGHESILLTDTELKDCLIALDRIQKCG